MSKILINYLKWLIIANEEKKKTSLKCFAFELCSLDLFRSQKFLLFLQKKINISTDVWYVNFES